MANLRLRTWVGGMIAAGLGFVAGVGGGSNAWAAATTQEPALTGVGKDGDYVRLVHDKIHPKWVDGYIRMSPYKDLGPSTSQREVAIRIAVRWDGTIEAAEVEKPSDAPEFDAAALNVVLLSAPFPPPVEVLADDGLAHLRWRFARDHRMCSSGQVVHVEFPLHMALPNLTARGRLEEAVRRMRDQLAHQGWSGGDFVTPFAQQWLTRPNLSTDLDTRAAAALAFGGDRRQSAVLQKSLLLPQVAAVAASALERLGVNVGSLLNQIAAGDDSGISNSSRAQAVVAAIRAVPVAASSCAACLDALIAVARDPRQPAAARVQVIEILSRLGRSEAIAAALSYAEKDSNVGVRAAAMLANLPPGRTRPGVIRMAARLHDPAPEIRAAASAGVLRAGGDAGLEQLYLIGREKDPRPLVATANELAHFSSEASATLLAKLLKRPEKNVRVAAIKALANRQDAAARKWADPILDAARSDAAEDPVVRQMVMASASPDELANMARDPRLGLAVYRTWLRAEKREDAARWLLDNLVQLPPEDRIAVLGDWIAELPAYAARQ